MTDSQREWARLGAQARLLEIEKERSEIFKAYPDLRNASDGSSRPKRKMSSAARRAMSEGMRRYWAKRKHETRT